MEENNSPEISSFQVFDNPQDLSDSMQSEQPQVEATPEPTPEPVAEPAVEQEVIPEQTQETPYVEPEPAPQQETQEYTDADYEQAVLSYMSERLGRQFETFEDFNAPQQSALDERIEAIARFVDETGRGPEDWFAYQSLNPSEMDDITAIRVNMAAQYPNLSQEELGILVQSKYNVDPDLASEEELRVAQVQMKVDAQAARQSIEELRSNYRAPEAQPSQLDSIVDDTWVSEMSADLDDMTGLEFDLGNDRSFTFGLEDSYKSQLKQKNARLDEYFDPYINEDGSWDYETLSSHRAVVDNIDAIVASAYKQGLGDGQRTLVDKAANVQSQSPVEGSGQATDPLASQLKNIMAGNRGKMTFKF